MDKSPSRPSTKQKQDITNLFNFIFNKRLSQSSHIIIDNIILMK